MDKNFTKAVHDSLTWFANKVSETVVYDNWDDELCRREVREGLDKVKDYLANVIDWNNLTKEECKFLRFCQWSEESKIMLIPIWLYKMIPVGTTLYGIGGDKIIFDGHNIDTDIRYGCLAYGIIPKE